MGRNSTSTRSSSPRLGTRVVGRSELRRIRGPSGEKLAATSPERLARVGKLFDSGQQNKVGIVSVTVGRDGSMRVEQGRHRILAALERNAKLQVTFRRGRS